VIGDTRFEGQPGACEESPDDRRYAAVVPAGFGITESEFPASAQLPFAWVFAGFRWGGHL